ncbi:MAG: hypothetical protein Q8O67_30805 [Deltaproteobacteria bacterium]|nr:hypothetical protein [Deltaproteobacteria bacterium]
MSRSIALLIAAGALAFVGCTLGSQILEVGAECVEDADCVNKQLECVRADSANATRVCMPIDDSAGGE